LLLAVIFRYDAVNEMLELRAERSDSQRIRPAPA